MPIKLLVYISIIIGLLLAPAVAGAVTVDSVPFVHSDALTNTGMIHMSTSVDALVSPRVTSTSAQVEVRAFQGTHNTENAITEADMLAYIEHKESKGNHLAQNPTSTAFGRFQFLNSTWKTVGCVKTPDPVEQERCAILYMEQRYGGIEGAYNFHKKNNWY